VKNDHAASLPGSYSAKAKAKAGLKSKSHGKVKLESGTAAYHIRDSTKGEDVSVEGLLQVPGFPYDLTSHRCELAGTRGIVTASIETVVEQYLLQAGFIEVGYDNEASNFRPLFCLQPSSTRSRPMIFNASTHPFKLEILDRSARERPPR
jgi:hypothetical protein